MTTFLSTTKRIVELSRCDAKGVANMGLKLMEEVGEFAECINFAEGYLPHKQMKEPAIAEAADVIQNVICILGQLYPDHSGDEIFEMLEKYMHTKTDKWEGVMVKTEGVAVEKAPDVSHEMQLINALVAYNFNTLVNVEYAAPCGPLFSTDNFGAAPTYATAEDDVIPTCIELVKIKIAQAECDGYNHINVYIYHANNREVRIGWSAW